MIMNIPKYEFDTSEYHDCLEPLYKNKWVKEFNENGEENKLKNLTYGSVELMANGDICSVPVFVHINMSSPKDYIQCVHYYLDKFNLPFLDTFLFSVHMENRILKTRRNDETTDKNFIRINTDDLIDKVYLNEIKKFYIIVRNDTIRGQFHYVFEDLFLLNLWEPEKIYGNVIGHYKRHFEYFIYYFEFYN